LSLVPPLRRGRPARRVGSVLLGTIIALGGLGVRLVQIQIVNAPRYEEFGLDKRVQKATIPAMRGAILDRNLEAIAISAEGRVLYADPALIEDPRAAARALAPVLGAKPRDLIDPLDGPGRYAYLMRDASPSLARTIDALDLGPGIASTPTIRRVHPNGKLAAQVVGFTGTDDQGLSGLESTYDALLQGTDGVREVERDRLGRPIPGARLVARDPLPGHSLVLTLDRDLQWVAEQSLVRALERTGAKGGTAIVMDPRTGDVLAMANAPLFSPVAFDRATEERRRNRAVTDAYEPGSVNKVITAAAVIDAGLSWPGEKLRVPSAIRIGRYTFRDVIPTPGGRMTYAEALAKSSNLATIQMAGRLGKERLERALRRFGLGTSTGIGFPGESAGILPPSEDWTPTSMASIPIGQAIAVSPLQVAGVYGTIANDGVRVRPRLIKAVIGGDGEVHERPIARAIRVVSPAAAASVRQMLVGVVEVGTGVMAQIDGYLVAGKTGTARKPLVGRRGYSSEIITTFAGFAPADDPRFVVTVALDNPTPRYAATTAAPVFTEIMTFALAQHRVRASVPRLDPPAPAPFVPGAMLTTPSSTDPLDPAALPVPSPGGAASPPPAPNGSAVPQPSSVPTARRVRASEPAA
jgi:cell division protein FtsI (penicillin-binding protein 3)